MNKVLILGGTSFIGRNLVERLLTHKGCEITLFNRQRTHANLFPTISNIKGDRETTDIKKLAGTQWDYVIDLSCFFPDSLDRMLNTLNPPKNYILISTCSVYDHEINKSILKEERSPILLCSSDQRTDRTPESYGNRKAECERVLLSSGIPYTILRPALVYGKYDPTDRLYYWLYQVKNKDVILLPERGERLFSSTYVSDLVETIVRSLDMETGSNVYNVITTPKTSLGQLVEHASQLIQRKISILNVSAEFLKNHNISQWKDMPLWIQGDYFTYNNQRLKEEVGIRTTDLHSALEHTIGYFDSIKWPKPKYGITEKVKQHLINKARSTSESDWV